MKKNWKRIGLVAMVLALSAMMVFASVSFAQGNGPTNQAGDGNAQANRYGRGSGGAGSGYGLAVRGAWGGAENSLVATAAEVLDMEQADLVAELQAGQTIAQVAEANDVAVQDIVDAFLAPRAEFLAQAVANGQITQADADAMQARMRATVTAKTAQTWEPRGNGNGTGTPGQGRGANWVDDDGDGTCDNFGGAHQNMRSGKGMAGRGRMNQ